MFSYVLNVWKLKLKNSVDNGNWIDANGARVPFWKWKTARQLQALADVEMIFNEDELGEYFLGDHVQHMTILRNPIDVVLSVMQNFFYVRHSNDGKHVLDKRKHIDAF